MTDERHVPDIGLSDATRRALAEHLVPPGGEGYWDGLHARITARLAGAETEWWMVLGRWARVGIAAAILVIALAGAALATAVAPDALAAYDELVVQSPAIVPVPTSPMTTNDRREETLRVLMSY